jgi:hypothetical protein
MLADAGESVAAEALLRWAAVPHAMLALPWVSATALRE